MGIRQRWRELWGPHKGALEPARRLDLSSGFNVRELGGYAVPGGETAYRRFLRSGSLDTLSLVDQRRLHEYGVRQVLDLRGNYEVEMSRDRLTEMPGVRYLHVPLYDIDISDPKLEHNDDSGAYFTLGYLTMLANRDAIGHIFSFFALAGPENAVLFHCAAGMDRTGVTAMLLLGLAGASRERIVADYCYSFGSNAEVDHCVFDGAKPKRRELELRIDAMNVVLDRLLGAYGSFEEYLRACGVTNEEMSAVRMHLMR